MNWPAKSRFALISLLSDRTPGIVDPSLYLKASGESVALALIGAWVVTFVYNPDMVANNPIQSRGGYNNTCVG
jgi:hypothetical protein